MRFISSRTTAATRSSTILPSGNQVQMPEATRRTYPPRTSSLWLGTSAAARAARRVRRNNDDMRRTEPATGETVPTRRSGLDGISLRLDRRAADLLVLVAGAAAGADRRLEDAIAVHGDGAGLR